MDTDNQKERYCSNCGRVYAWDDWQEETCPFCDFALEEVGVAAPAAILSDTLSSELGWPQGEREVEVYRASGFLDAQMIKAQLESAGIPVLLLSASQLGFTVGALGAVPVMVPVSKRDEALEILENDAD